jgi:hypothetical protein
VAPGRWNRLVRAKLIGFLDLVQFFLVRYKRFFCLIDFLLNTISVAFEK